MEKLFAADILSKRERVERTLRHQAVDRVALHDQLSYSASVISHYTGRTITDFDYTLEDIGCAIRNSLDMCFPMVAPTGTARITSPDGFVLQYDNWTTWRVSRPFTDEHGARQWLQYRTQALEKTKFNPNTAREEFRTFLTSQQALIGETVICAFSGTGFCDVFDCMGLEIFTFFMEEYPDDLTEYMELSTQAAVNHANAAADINLTPVILIPEDFATKQGPIFRPDFLNKYHFPYVKRLTQAWHDQGITVLYHSDGNYKKVVPDLMECGVDGFYCLEPAVGMDIVELKNTWPQMVWAGGIDGVDIMELGTPQMVKDQVIKHITETNALQTGGMFIATSSEINPPVRAENYLSMIQTTGILRNPDFPPSKIE